MFMGEYNHNVDAKGRLILPSRFREEIGSTCVITKGYEGCLNVYPTEEWDRFVASLGSLSEHNKDARRVLRIFASGASNAEPDKQGRVLLPQNLREYAQLTEEKSEVVVVGAFSKIEIWNLESWKNYNQGEDAMSLEEAGENLSSFGLK